MLGCQASTASIFLPLLWALVPPHQRYMSLVTPACTCALPLHHDSAYARSFPVGAGVDQVGSPLGQVSVICRE
ncbi:hypothetical protein XELAEV_18044846mg [Xenopus laevis]|uniref:Secreted protein n=1 Tax=Xenopus laevis TaxID=8355 RepID=A0A974BZF8_XENLA|nr:hypothetical protein XELAEV_18044846mg [Xenopus laevis]